MALGDYSNNKMDQPRKPTIYSPYSMTNTYSKVDPSRISFSFWNRMLKIAITPMIDKNEAGVPTWDSNNAISAYLTHTKAKILASEIRNFMRDSSTYNSSGIISNETLVTISDGSEFGTSGLFLVLRKINKEDGKTLSSYSYEFNTGFHSSVRNYNEKEASFSNEFDEYSALELEQFLQLLDSYAEAMTYSYSYAVADTMDYNHRQVMQGLESCAKALGVTINTSNGNNKSSNSVFSPRNNSSKSNFSSAMNPPETTYVSAESVEEDLFG